MKFLHTISTIFWLLLLVIACNTTPDTNAPKEDVKTENDSPTKVENNDESASINVDISGETFPEGGSGFKGRHNDYVFYLEVSDLGIEGFVRHKNDDSENEVTGKMSSPFDFNAEELLEDEDGETTTIAKLRGKKGDDENSFELDYNDTNSAETFKVTLKR